MEREACVCDHGFERSDLCAEIIIITIMSFIGVRAVLMGTKSCTKILIFSTRFRAKILPSKIS